MNEATQKNLKIILDFIFKNPEFLKNYNFSLIPNWIIKAAGSDNNDQKIVIDMAITLFAFSKQKNFYENIKKEKPFEEEFN